MMSLSSSPLRRPRTVRATSRWLALFGVVAVVASAGCGSDGSNSGGNPDGAPDDDVRSYTVEFFVQNAGRFGALQLDITHLGNSGGFIGRGDEVDCHTLVEAIAVSNYVGERVVKVGLISLHGIATPSAILRCGFRTSEELDSGDFQIDVTDASDTNSDPLDPVPTVVISEITER